MTEENKVVTIEERNVEFVPLGASDTIRLSASLVSKFIAVPTKSGALPSERDCIKFIMLCKGKQANPFEGDVFMIGYDVRRGNKTVPSFSMVCGIELFLKRAEQSENYDGRESGIVVQTDEGIVERHGCMLFPGDTLVGGWARVYRKDRQFPEYKRVALDVYNTHRSRWEKDPGGQIEKVALSQAMRQGFPTPLGGLYTQQEMERVTEDGDNLLHVAKEAVKMPEMIDVDLIEAGKETDHSETTPKAKKTQTSTEAWVCQGCHTEHKETSKPVKYCGICGLEKNGDPETGKYKKIDMEGELDLRG